MGSPPVVLEAQALRPVRRAGAWLATGCAIASAAAAALHAIRDGQLIWAAALLAASGLTLAIAWWPASAGRLTGCRWDDAGWRVAIEGQGDAMPATLDGIAATSRHLLLRVRSPLPCGRVFDELYVVDGDRLGDARWSRLRSTLRLTMSDAHPLA